MQETTTAPNSSEKREAANIFDILASTFDDLPEEMLAELPTDGAENHDHYLYGWPKKSETAERATVNNQ